MVVAIVAILGSIALPRMSASERRYRLELAAARLAADLDAARSYARANAEGVTITFNTVTETATFAGMRGDHGTDYVLDLARAPYRIDMATADFGGESKLAFDGYGSTSSTGSVTLKLGTSTVSVTISEASRAPIVLSGGKVGIK